MSTLTTFGMSAFLKGTGTPNGALANIATAIKLYTSASTPAKDGSGFTEVANGNGYTTGGIAITTADWTYAFDGTNGAVTLANKSWTASGGNIANVAGAYVTDGSGNVLAWWPRSGGAVTESPPDQIQTSGLAVSLA